MTTTEGAKDRAYRAVDGAIRNAQHAHPEIKLTRSQRASIAKRAAGTLSAMPGALAAGPSDSGGGVAASPGARGQMTGATGRVRGLWPSRFRKLRLWLGIQASAARKAGDAARLEACVDVLRHLAELERGQPHGPDAGPGLRIGPKATP